MTDAQDPAAYAWPAGGAPDDLERPGRGLVAPFVGGGAFILDAPDRVPALWGEGDRVLWAEGEALMVCGGPGVGKTTITGQLVRALLAGGDVLGLPVARRRRVLYLAMDRPRQIARSLRRQFGPEDSQLLARGLVIHPGPPYADAARDDRVLLNLVEAAEADVLVVDSIKDAAVGLSEDAVGAGYNRARQRVIAAGVDVLELHHLVKRGPNGGAPRELADVYGSTWLTSGAGSVIVLEGAAGDPLVKLHHLKQPAGLVGPLDVLHDHAAGVSRVAGQLDPLELLDAQGGALTARELATALTEADRPKPADVERARRALEGYVRTGALVSELDTGAVAGKGVTVYRRRPS